MVEISESYYSSSGYNNSESYFFDNNRQGDFFDKYTPMDSTS